MLLDFFFLFAFFHSTIMADCIVSSSYVCLFKGKAWVTQPGLKLPTRSGNWTRAACVLRKHSATQLHLQLACYFIKMQCGYVEKEVDVSWAQRPDFQPQHVCLVSSVMFHQRLSQNISDWAIEEDARCGPLSSIDRSTHMHTSLHAHVNTQTKK